MAEVFDLYLALQHANIPTDFVEEEDLTPAGLKDYKVVYVTEPDVPAEFQKGLAEWVKQGGTLVTVSGAAASDRYDEPCAILADATGIHEERRQRLLIPGHAADLKPAAKGKAAHGAFASIGVAGKMKAPPDAAVLARFDNGIPATVHRKVGKGQAVHFAWFPGMSYFPTGDFKEGPFYPVNFSKAIRDAILEPVALAGVQTPVRTVPETAQIETPMLLSEKGAAVTLLNWTNQSYPDLTVEVACRFASRVWRASARACSRRCPPRTACA